MNPLKVSFKPQVFPKMLADLSHSNQFLKVFATASMLISLGLLILVSALASRGPVVIALSPQAGRLQKVEMPKPELEVQEAVRAYVELRYNWDHTSVDAKLESAKAFVSSQFVQNFVQGVSNVRKFSKEKNVAQRAYAANITVDLKRSVATVTGDRISEIQGIRAVGALNIELTFQSGPRTDLNPWGIYIVRETEK